MKKLVLIGIAILLTTGVCVGLGLTQQVPDDEKQNGLTGIFDVSVSGDIAYVRYESGKATVYVKSKDVRQVAQLPPDRAIADIVIMPDGNTLFYVNSSKDRGDTTERAVHKVDVATGADEVLFSKDAIITELAYDAAIEDQIFYLQADIFTNYSPVASAQPHEFDVHRYNLKQKTHQQITDLKKYGMASLQVSGKEDSVYIQMDADENAETAEEIFEMKQRIFQIPLAHPEQSKMIFMPNDPNDLYDFVLVPDQSLLIYQAVAGTNSKGIYEYELFSYDWETMETKRLTFHKEHTARPVFGADGYLYYVIDYNFAGRNTEYELFRLNPESGDTEQVSLDE
ncbi:TolB-like translocation protein [Sporosarcina aquimarina]|uniref:DUF5050 domain-containing protein n=1 Tax=Sporosarcina aquimarina TaxID=114975 RepID=A0ABU4G1Q4_9BACL|nr:hypothetical protein [Sporosarcina aquimarina]MDW0110881.1 hypothetical protein [Sporosarcina aquimarina]